MAGIRRLQRKAIRAGLNPEEIYSLRNQNEIIAKMRELNPVVEVVGEGD